MSWRTLIALALLTVLVVSQFLLFLRELLPRWSAGENPDLLVAAEIAVLVAAGFLAAIIVGAV